MKSILTSGRHWANGSSGEHVPPNIDRQRVGGPRPAVRPLLVVARMVSTPARCMRSTEGSSASSRRTVGGPGLITSITGSGSSAGRSRRRILPSTTLAPFNTTPAGHPRRSAPELVESDLLRHDSPALPVRCWAYTEDPAVTLPTDLMQWASVRRVRRLHHGPSITCPHRSSLRCQVVQAVEASQRV